MLLRNARLTVPAILALVLLRLVIGWHFFMEGTDKVKNGGFSSVGFLSSAKGPFAKKFQSMIPDFDGETRLDESAMKSVYEGFAAQAGELYKITEEQKSEAESVTEKFRKKLKAIYRESKAAIDEYKNGTDRVAQLQNDPMRDKVAGMSRQRDDIESKWRALARPILYDVDKITADFENEINLIATDAQRGKDKLSASLKYPNAPPIDVKLIDKIIPIFDMSVGILLIIGLLTPLAGIAAGLFLASVVLTQFPGSHGSVPTYYQAIEMAGCFFLAFADAGRYAGLDFLPWSFWNRNRKDLVKRPRD